MTHIPKITSPVNDRIKHVHDLQSRRRSRSEQGRFVIEGVNLMREALAAHASIEDVFYTPPFAESPDGLGLLDELSRAGAALISVSEPVMQAMSDTQTPQGVLAVLPMPQLAAPAEATFTLLVDAISDPGNLGTIMRVASGAGVPLLVLMPGSVDPGNPKVIRSAMGAHFRLPVRHATWEGIADQLPERAIFLADSGGGVPCYRVDWTQPCALIVSGEAHGPSEQARRLAHARVTIPMPGGIESLNVGVATGILIYEMLRQRSVLEG